MGGTSEVAGAAARIDGCWSAVAKGQRATRQNKSSGPRGQDGSQSSGGGYSQAAED